MGVDIAPIAIGVDFDVYIDFDIDQVGVGYWWRVIGYRFQGNGLVDRKAFSYWLFAVG